jgi:hypothetical protein
MCLLFQCLGHFSRIFLRLSVPFLLRNELFGLFDGICCLPYMLEHKLQLTRGILCSPLLLVSARMNRIISKCLESLVGIRFEQTKYMLCKTLTVIECFFISSAEYVYVSHGTNMSVVIYL